MGFQAILQLRALHRELDEAVLAAYGWAGQISLGHDFHEVETLPENDRIRYTLSTGARKEVLRRLLTLNHERAAQEQTDASPKELKKPAKRTKRLQPPEDDLFTQAAANTAPASNWLDQPFAISAPSRTAFADADEYRAALVPELLRQLGVAAAFDRFHKAYWLLTRPDDLARVASKHIQGPIRSWRKSYPALLQGQDFLSELKGQVTMQRVRIFRGKDNVRRIDLLAANVPSFADVVEDARLAILVTDLWPSTEEQVPALPATDEKQLAKWEMHV